MKPFNEIYCAMTGTKRKTKKRDNRTKYKYGCIIVQIGDFNAQKTVFAKVVAASIISKESITSKAPRLCYRTLKK